MSYDFFVFPADAAPDVTGATRLYEATSDRGPLTPEGPMAGFLASLETAGLDASGHDGGAVVRTSWDDPRNNLSVVAGLARPHGLSVLDVQLTALYDPRGAVDVPLVTEAGPCLPFVTRPVLHDVLDHLVERRYTWLRLGPNRVSSDGAAFSVDGVPVSATDIEDRLWSLAVSSGVEA
ncbi:MAG: hypothetical protein ABIQ59_12810 [Nocardioidaceae bacterium]